MPTNVKPIVMLLPLLVLGACTTTGSGTGLVAGGSLSGRFDWKESAATDGEMTANLSDGRQYAGRYFQITEETRVNNLQPLWMGWGGPGMMNWGGGWGGWGAAGPWGGWGPSQQFVRSYSGRVVANLKGPTGYMRCRFTLARPAAGMDGGGEGQCQMPDGRVFDTSFPPH
jgi:hypothetical protein